MGAATGLQRRVIHYEGHVQGVGFRYTTRSIAQQFEVTGHVQNLDDGRVRIVVEGESEEIDRFLARLEETMSRFIRHIGVSICEATGEFDRFSIGR